MSNKYYITCEVELSNEDIGINRIVQVIQESFRGSESIKKIIIIDIQTDVEKDSEGLWKVPEEKDESQTTISLHENEYKINPATGELSIHKEAFDDFCPGQIITITFPEAAGSPSVDYLMIDEDEDEVYCDYLG